MTKYIKYLLIGIITIVGLSSCTSDESDLKGEDSIRYGSFSLGDIQIDEITSDIVSVPLSRANEAVDVNSFHVRIIDSDNQSIVYEGKISQLKRTQTHPLEVGSYEILVSSFTDSAEPIAKISGPFYQGSTTFEIKENLITDIPIINCTLRNLKVGIQYSDAIKRHLGSDIKVEITSSPLNGTLTFGTNEGEYGYFKIDKNNNNSLTTHIEGTIDGSKVSASQTINDVKAGEFCLFYFDVKTPDAGPWSRSSSILITHEKYK